MLLDIFICISRIIVLLHLGKYKICRFFYLWFVRPYPHIKFSCKVNRKGKFYLPSCEFCTIYRYAFLRHFLEPDWMLFFDRIPPAMLPRATIANVTPIPSYWPPKNKAVIESRTPKNTAPFSIAIRICVSFTFPPAAHAPMQDALRSAARAQYPILSC